MKALSKILISAAAAMLFAAAAWAGSMEARFGNTVVASAPDGTVTKFHYDKAGTFTATIAQPGKPAVNAKGKWRQDGDKLCITSDTAFGPFEANKESCVPLMGDKVGDKWKSKSKDAAGNVVDVDVTIVAGK
jgi:YD repeat-containing protein